MKPKIPEGFSTENYRLDSGDQNRYGVNEYSVTTGTSARFAHYKNNQDNGKWILSTPGSSVEVLGQAMKAKGNEGTTSQRAKQIFAKHGDIYLEAPDGEIVLRAKNIRLVADGGGDDGDVTINANHILNLKANHDVRVTSDNTIAMTAAKDMNLIVQGFYELKYGFAMAASHADSNFGAASIILNAIGLKV